MQLYHESHNMFLPFRFIPNIGWISGNPKGRAQAMLFYGDGEMQTVDYWCPPRTSPCAVGAPPRPTAARRAQVRVQAPRGAERGARGGLAAAGGDGLRGLDGRARRLEHGVRQRGDPALQLGRLVHGAAPAGAHGARLHLPRHGGRGRHGAPRRPWRPRGAAWRRRRHDRRLLLPRRQRRRAQQGAPPATRTPPPPPRARANKRHRQAAGGG